MSKMTDISDHSDRIDQNELGLFKEENESAGQLVHHGFPCFGMSRMAVIFGLAMIGSIATNVAITFSAVRASKEMTVSEDGLLVAARKNNNNAVATLGTGLTFQFEVKTDQDMETFPYTCVETEAAMDLWRAVSHGINTNVVLQQHDVEIGVSMTFQGSSKNASHACLATMDYRQEQKLCIDFVSNRCDSAYPKLSKQQTAAPVITEQTIFGPDDRRALFEHGLQNDNGDHRRRDPVSAIRGSDGTGRGRRRRRRVEESEEYVCADYGGMGCFYSEFISIVFVGA